MLLWQATTWHGMLNVQSNFQWLPYSIHFPRSQFYTRESGRDWPLSAISTLPSPIFCKAFPPPSPRPWWSWACCFNSYCISFYQNLSLNGTLLERNPCFFKPFFPSKLSTAIFGRDVFSGEYFSVPSLHSSCGVAQLAAAHALLCTSPLCFFFFFLPNTHTVRLLGGSANGVQHLFQLLYYRILTFFGFLFLTRDQCDVMFLVPVGQQPPLILVRLKSGMSGKFEPRLMEVLPGKRGLSIWMGPASSLLIQMMQVWQTPNAETNVWQRYFSRVVGCKITNLGRQSSPLMQPSTLLPLSTATPTVMPLLIQTTLKLSADQGLNGWYNIGLLWDGHKTAQSVQKQNSKVCPHTLEQTSTKLLDAFLTIFVHRCGYILHSLYCTLCCYKAGGSQACSSHRQLIFGFALKVYLSNSTKMTTYTETAMLSRQWATIWVELSCFASSTINQCRKLWKLFLFWKETLDIKVEEHWT